MNFKQFICSSSFISVNKSLAKEIGLHEAIIYSVLCSKMEYHENNNTLDSSGYFYCTNEYLEEETMLTYRQQKGILINLINLGILSSKKAGLPCRTYYRIGEEEMDCFKNKFVQNVITGSNKKSLSDDTICNNTYNNKDNNKITINKNIDDFENTEHLINQIPLKENKKPKKEKYGSQGNVTLTEIEFGKLKSEFNGYTEKAIEYLSLYKVEKDYKTKSDYLTIRRWVIDAVKQREPKQETKPIETNFDKINIFYLKEIEKNKSDVLCSDYEQFHRILFGQNSLKSKLTGCLSVPVQVSFEQYKLIDIAKTRKNVKITSMLLTIENDRKYYESKEYLFSVIMAWIDRANDFKK